jgi:Tol biopolymer transport system component
VSTSPAAEYNAVFSPDGKWLAYDSDQTGRPEVYVVSFPDLGAKQQVSRESGFLPRWSANGELFFIEGAPDSPARIMRARRTGGTGTIACESPMRLFDIPNGFDFDVAPDGRNFYYVAPNPDAPAREIRVVVNWLQELLSTSHESAK